MSDPVTDDPRLDPRVEEEHGLRPDTVEAVGKLSEAFETTEVARGHLYQFHQLTGHADLLAGEAAELLRKAGHAELADRVETELVGRNILAGRWTFQIVEEYDDDYHALFKELNDAGTELTAGLRHLHEAGMKRDRRTEGRPGHERTPSDR